MRIKINRANIQHRLQLRRLTFVEKRLLQHNKLELFNRMHSAQMIQKALGHPLDKRTFRRFLNLQSRLQRDGAEADGIALEELLKHFQTTQRMLFYRLRLLLGHGRFMALFGKTGIPPQTVTCQQSMMRAMRFKLNQPPAP